MKFTVYTLEDFRADYEHGVIGVYSSFEKAKEGLIGILKESVASYEDELDECECEDNEYAEKLCSFITELKESIKNMQKAKPNPYYTCNQLYLTEHILD